MPGTSIREAHADDAEALVTLIAQLGYPVAKADMAERLCAMAEAGNRVFVAQLHGRVVGCLTTAAMQVLHRPAKVGRISMMVVEEGLRGQGIGRDLVAAAEAFLCETGCYMVEVTSRFELTQAHRFYEALGFEQTSVRLARNIE